MSGRVVGSSVNFFPTISLRVSSNNPFLDVIMNDRKVFMSSSAQRIPLRFEANWQELLPSAASSSAKSPSLPEKTTAWIIAKQRPNEKTSDFGVLSVCVICSGARYSNVPREEVWPPTCWKYTNKCSKMRSMELTVLIDNVLSGILMP